MEEKNLQLERTVFFCDAVVAIAITLLALDIKVPHEAATGGHITFEHITAQWRAFAAFLLSFINIANFWKTHHTFFSHINNVDERLLWFNIAWLFFIVLLPFSTSLIGEYFSQSPAMFIYALNIFIIAICQNSIWDYASWKGRYIKQEKNDERILQRYRLFCNLDMLNGLVAVILSLFYPVLSFVLLYTKLPMIIIVGIYYRHERGERHARRRRNE